MVSFLTFLLSAIALVTLSTNSAAQRQPAAPCVGQFPMEVSAIGKKDSAPGGCSPGGQSITRTYNIYKWGLFVSERYAPVLCRQEIVVAYRKSNMPAMIYYRPYVTPVDIKSTHPVLYRKFRNGDYSTPYPCDKVPVQNVHVWKNRKLFVRLLNNAVRIIAHIRDFDCGAPEVYGDPNDTFTWTELRKRIASDRAPTAAINFLQGVAFSNFFCV